MELEHEPKERTNRRKFYAIFVILLSVVFVIGFIGVTTDSSINITMRLVEVSPGTMWEYNDYDVQECTFPGHEILDDCYGFFIYPNRVGVDDSVFGTFLSLDKSTLLMMCEVTHYNVKEGNPSHTKKVTYSYDYVEYLWPLSLGKESELTKFVRVEDIIGVSTTTTTMTIRVVHKVERLQNVSDYVCFKIIESDINGKLLSAWWYSEELGFFARTKNYFAESEESILEETYVLSSDVSSSV